MYWFVSSTFRRCARFHPILGARPLRHWPFVAPCSVASLLLNRQWKKHMNVDQTEAVCGSARSSDCHLFSCQLLMISWWISHTQDRQANAKGLQILRFGWEWEVWLKFESLLAPPLFRHILNISECQKYQRFALRRIDVNELKEAMKLMGEDFQIRSICRKSGVGRHWTRPQDLNDAEVNALFAAVDHDGNDAISFEEFCVLARILSWRL